MNPYAIGAVIVVLLATHSGMYFKGRSDESVSYEKMQLAANRAAVDALVKIREELRPKVTNFYNETTKYPDCHATKEGHDALMELYK